MTIVVPCLVFGAIFVGLLVKPIRQLRRTRGTGGGVWWQNIKPYCWISLACYIPLFVIAQLVPAIPVAAALLPIIVIVGLNAARLIGTHRSEREEVDRDSAFGRPTHTYLQSTTGIILAIEMIAALVLLFVASAIADRGPLSQTMNTIDMVIACGALVVAVAGIGHYLYRRARRHHENVLIALHTSNAESHQ